MSSFSSAVGSDVHLRIPTWMRIYGIVFSIFWFGMLIVMTVAIVSSGQPAGAIMPVFMGVFGAFVISRVFRIGVRSSGDAAKRAPSASSKNYEPGRAVVW